jgi:hypothetical protein
MTVRSSGKNRIEEPGDDAERLVQGFRGNLDGALHRSGVAGLP